MARYYFDIDDGARLTTDATGIECAGREAVRTAALKALPDIVRDCVPDGNEQRFRVLARDDDGQSVFHVTLKLSAGWGGPPN